MPLLEFLEFRDRVEIDGPHRREACVQFVHDCFDPHPVGGIGCGAGIVCLGHGRFDSLGAGVRLCFKFPDAFADFAHAYCEREAVRCEFLQADLVPLLDVLVDRAGLQFELRGADLDGAALLDALGLLAPQMTQGLGLFVSSRDEAGAFLLKCRDAPFGVADALAEALHGGLDLGLFRLQGGAAFLVGLDVTAALFDEFAEFPDARLHRLTLVVQGGMALPFRGDLDLEFVEFRRDFAFPCAKSIE